MNQLFSRFLSAFRSETINRPEGRLVIFTLILFFAFLVFSFFYLPLSLILSAIVLFLLSLFTLFLLLAQFTVVKQDTQVERSELKEILVNLEDALVVYDKDFRVIFFNPAAEKLFHIRKDEVVGKILTPQSVSNESLKLLTQVIFTSLAPVMISRSEAGMYPQVTDLSWENPFLNFRTSTMPLRDELGEVIGFMKIVRDRTHEISLIKSKNEFIAVASHQLRTPVTNLKWSLESLANEGGLSEAAQGYLTSAMEGQKLLLAVIEDLLSTSKIEEGRFGYEIKEADLVDFIGEILPYAKTEAEKIGVKLYFDRPTNPLPKVFMDTQKITMVLENLLDNALRYNVKDGEVTVRLVPVEGQPFIDVQVKDTGVGIPKSATEKLFTKFFRAENVMKSQTTGTGLGLYIARNIIQAHGGRVWAESEENRGTTMHFTLSTDRALVPTHELPLDLIA
ncbi:MAG: ATP-binding protein [Patescibacteria group bacterium]